MANFVLVHGAWHGGWCYARVAKILRTAGHDVFTPTLTGLGERSHLLRDGVNLDTHVQDVLNVVEWEGLDRLVLCGHSYGGIVATAVADAIAEKLTAVVYLDAFIPENGDTTIGLLAPERQKALQEEAGRNGGLAVAPPDVSMYGVNANDKDWVQAKVTPHPFASFTQPIRLTGACRSINRIYVYAKGEVISAPYYEKCLRDPDWTVYVTEQGGHDQMIDDPITVAGILMKAAVQ
jgi:pimeloyl-ACP methyl ester carboxylesterase